MTENTKPASANPTPPTEMTYDQWAEYGLRKGWVGPAVCYTHDGLPLTESEEDEFETADPCVHIMRLYPDELVRAGVEVNHAPSNWRKGSPALF